jgi:hypothetical protein
VSGFDIDAMRAAVAKATPGPWLVRQTVRGVATAIEASYACVNGLSAWFGIARIDRPGDAEIGYTGGAYDGEVSDANARLIALAPAMAAEIERLTAENARMIGFVAELREALIEAKLAILAWGQFDKDQAGVMHDAAEIDATLERTAP